MLAEFIKLPKEGESVGPYILRQILSTSILGTFYQATHKLKHRNVLLHIIPEALMRADSRFQQKYKKTIESQAELTHNAAMAATELHRIGGNLVIQYPEGNYRSINEIVLNRPEPMPEERVKELVYSIGKGLEDAVGIGLGHYFMSPDFLFVNEDGELRIAGIGLFQAIQYECFERFVSGAVLPISIDKKRSFSALEILSPEIRNFKARDLRSDFYCIGMCAYFMLTGTKPLRRWATPTKARKEIGEGWDILISKCLEPKPTDRFPNYRAFIQDLEHLEDLAAGIDPGENKGLSRILRKLPLPKFLETMRGTHLIRLILLGAAGVIVIGTASIFFEIIYSDYEVEVTENPLSRVDRPEKANLAITVTQPDAMVIIRGPQSGRYSPKGRTIYLKGKRGQYIIRVMARNHQVMMRTIDLDTDELVEQNFALLPDFASIDVRGAIGTEVYVLQEDDFLLHIGTIEKNSGLLVEDRLLKGDYTFLGLHRSLKPAVSEQVSLQKETMMIRFTQPPKPTELVVSSAPEGASVYVEGKLLGLTPLKVDGLTNGQPLTLRVEKEGYRSIREDIFLEKGQRLTIDAGVLVEKIGTLQYNVEIPEQYRPSRFELMLSLNDEALEYKESDSFKLPEGEYVLTLDHPDYFPAEATVQVLDGELTEVALVLKPRPLRIFPILNARHQARYMIDGQPAELTPEGYLLMQPDGDVKVSAIVTNFLTVTREFSGKPHQRLDWEIPLKPIPGPETGKDWAPPYFAMEMAWLAAGSFKMGSDIQEFRRLPNEDSLTNVTIGSGFWISIHEVTQNTFLRVMRTNPSEFKAANQPVESVSWSDANEFCKRITQYERNANRLPEGYAYRLPTEAEWEYACRAGTSTPFSFGEEADPSKGNFQGTFTPGVFTGKSTDETYGTRPVGSYTPNAFGLYDIHGNVAEWTFDQFWDRHPGNSVTDPVVKSGGRGYVVKGGSWEDSADRVRSAAREGVSRRSVRSSIGFRVVLAPGIK